MNGNAVGVANLLTVAVIGGVVAYFVGTVAGRTVKATQRTLRRATR